MEENKNNIDMENLEAKGDEFKRKLKVVKEIAYVSIMETIENRKTWTYAAGIGLYQGLKYKGNLRLGLNGGLATLGVLVGVSIVQNVVHNRDTIKKA